jgi:hypothetical protein
MKPVRRVAHPYVLTTPRVPHPLRTRGLAGFFRKLGREQRVGALSVADLHWAFFSQRIIPITALPPLLRRLHQASRHWVAMHVTPGAYGTDHRIPPFATKLKNQRRASPQRACPERSRGNGAPSLICEGQKRRTKAWAPSMFSSLRQFWIEPPFHPAWLHS